MRLSFPECTERMRKIMMMAPLNHTTLKKSGKTGSGLTDDEETTATSRSDEAVRAGGVMEGLISSMALDHF